MGKLRKVCETDEMIILDCGVVCFIVRFIYPLEKIEMGFDLEPQIFMHQKLIFFIEN